MREMHLFTHAQNTNHYYEWPTVRNQVSPMQLRTKEAQTQTTSHFWQHTSASVNIQLMPACLSGTEKQAHSVLKHLTNKSCTFPPVLYAKESLLAEVSFHCQILCPTWGWAAPFPQGDPDTCHRSRRITAVAILLPIRAAQDWAVKHIMQIP